MDVAGQSRVRRARGPSSQKTAQTRQKVATAALELFIECGYRATRMEDVAARAGVAKGTVYLHFADKQALFGGVIADVLDNRLAELSMTSPAEGKSVGDFLRNTLTPLISELESSPWIGLVRLIMTEGHLAPEIAAVYRQRMLDPLSDHIRTWSRIAADRGEIHTDVLQRMPLMLISPAILATIWSGLFPDEPMGLAETFNAFLDLIFAPATPPSKRR